MKSIRRNVFETNSSSTHSLSIANIAYYEKVEDVIPKGEPLYLGETDSSDFLLCTETTRYSGFKDKLHCLLAFLICYYEDKVEFWNNEILYEKFMQSCHYLWICELLKEKFDIELILREFRYSGVSMEDDFFESMELPLFYPVEFKENVENILTNSDIVLEYICESW